MPIFYTDSGSFETLEVTGSTILSGSLIVSGATNFGPSGLTGSLFGSASYADSASFATTASFALNGGGSSTPAFPFSGSAVITGSLLVSGSSNISGALNLAGPSSYGAGSSIGSIRFNFPSTAIDTSSGQFIIDFDQAYDDSEYNNLKITNTIAQNTSTGVGAVYNQVTLQNTDLFVESISSTNNGTLAGFQAIAGQTGSMPRMQGDLLIISRTASFGTILGNGNVGLGPALVLISGSTQMTGSLGVLGTVLVNGQISASSYTSSLNNQVGFLGTSSFAVSSSQTISASFAQTAVTASYFSGSVNFPDGLTVGQLTASNAQLTNIVDTTATNKILVLNTANNQIFTTASVGGGTGTAFPFNGNAVITGSLLVSSSGTTGGLQISGSTRALGKIDVVSPANPASSMSISVGDVAGYASFKTSPDIVYYEFPSTQVVFNSGYISTADVAIRGAIKDDANTALRITGGTANSTQITGSAAIQNDLRVNGGTLFVDSANNRVNMSGSIAHTGSLTLLSSSLTINTGSISINTGSLTVDQLPGQTSGITLRVTGSNQVLYIGNDGQGSSFLKTSNTQLRFGGLGFNGFAWDGLSLYPESNDEENLGATGFRWKGLIVREVTASIVSASAGITGSLAQFNPVSLKITVGTTAPTSPAVNDLWVDTN